MKKSRTEEEIKLVKENQRLLRNIKSRLNRLVATKGKKNLYPYKKFKKTVKHKSTRGLSLKQLKEQQAQLRYINELKSTRSKGYKNYLRWENALKANYEGFIYADEEEMYEMYSHFIEDLKFDEKYKYEVMETISNSISEGEFREQVIKERVIDLLDEMGAIEKELFMEDKSTFYK